MAYTMYFYSGASPDTGRVRMRFQNLNNPNNRFFQPFWGITTLGTALDDAEETPLAIFPHPVKESARIRMPEAWQAGNRDVELVLYDLNGREVRRAELETGETLFHRGGLPDGLYFYRVSGTAGFLGEGKLLLRR